MENLKIALLVDVENYKEPMGLFGQFVNGIKPYGVITRKVAIGGWGFTKHLENWKSICNDHNIEMLGYNGFEGKNAADRAIVYKATQLIKANEIDAIAIYSRDTGFSIAFPALHALGAKILAPKMGKEYIPDADAYVNIERGKLSKNQPTTELGQTLMKVLPQFFI